ncbi:cytochrome P450 [Micromonospora sp. WMMC241]|uniref:cytochrome P450 n=1 Tax=Micromonospora sp. WMMC241 TaxID=3015159 RepID=UPI0022B6819E|nr:cytochrome P450 [Micromonospora sp. WMMC241]MCZ7440040.1 cytochrome P450 [Micromonospora sp. WMMC241]
MSITTHAPRREARPPRVPAGLPLVGHGLQLLRRRLDFLQEARRYGPVVRVGLGPSTAYLVNDHTLLHQMLVNDAALFPRGIHFRKARAVAGDGIITAEGPAHRRQRRLVLPAFSRKRVHGYGDVMRRIAMERISSWPEDRPIELKPEFVSLATTIGTRALFSTDLGASAVSVIERALPVLTRGVSLRAMDPTGLVEHLPLPTNRRFGATMRELHAVIDGIIASYRRTEQQGDDLLSLLMLATDEGDGKGMTDRQLRDEVISILLSSAETTALTMSWACHELGRHPEVFRSLRAEVDRVLPDGEPPRHEQLPELELTRRVVKETLRLYPPTYFLSRTATKDVRLGQHLIPGGSTVLYSFYSQHRDPRLFRDPHTFDPDRWLPERAADVTPEAYMPFGEGAHRCVGEGFAWAEAMTSLAIIALHRDLRPVDGDQVRPTGTVTLMPRGLSMVLPRRAA